MYMRYSDIIVDNNIYQREFEFVSVRRRCILCIKKNNNNVVVYVKKKIIIMET